MARPADNPPSARPGGSLFASLRAGITFSRPGTARTAPVAQDRPANGGVSAAAAAASSSLENAESAGVRLLSPAAAAAAERGASGHRRLAGSAKRARREALESQPGAAGAAARAATAAARAAEAAGALRNAHRIHVTGGAAPAPLSAWDPELRARYPACPSYLPLALASLGLESVTPVQMQAIPALMEGRPVLAVAPTGSGKTLAFLLPIAACLAKHATAGNPRAVVVSPTRELAAQSLRALRSLTAGKRLRGRLLSTKAGASAGGWDAADVVFATPQRLASLVASGGIDLTHVRFLILDEADKLMETTTPLPNAAPVAPGSTFLEQVDAVLAACTRPGLVRGLFSATLPEPVELLARTVMDSPLRITVGERGAASDAVRQSLLFVGDDDAKVTALRRLATEGGLLPPAIVFVRSQDRAAALEAELAFDGLRIVASHAGLSQARRDGAVAAFRAGEARVLVATDLLGRGLDFKGVATVVNYDFPDSVASYVHRVGRAGRAGATGTAVTFFTEGDAPRLRGVAHAVRASGGDVPAWMLGLKRVRDRGRDKRTREAAREAAAVEGGGEGDKGDEEAAGEGEGEGWGGEGRGGGRRVRQAGAAETGAGGAPKRRKRAAP